MISLFRIAGIPVRFEPSWLLVFALVAWMLATTYFPHVLPGLGAAGAAIHGAAAAALLFASVVVHELAHALVARRRGIAVSGIRLHVFGGVSELEDEPPSAAAEIAIALAGPIVSFMIAGLAFGAGSLIAPGSSAGAFLGYLAVVNLIIGVFNLLPAFPLDGGRVLRATLWAWTGSIERATAGAAHAGRVVAVGLAALGGLRMFAGDVVGGIWLLLIGLYVYQAARASAEVGELRARLERVRVRELMTPAAVADGVDARDPRVGPGDSAWLAFTRLTRSRAARLTVVDGGAVVGVLDRARLRDAIVRREPTALDRAA